MAKTYLPQTPISGSLSITSSGDIEEYNVWDTETQWHEVSMSNSWANYDPTWSGAAYRMDSEGFVHLKGLVKDGTFGTVIFNLPVGYRPLRNFYAGNICNANVQGYIFVDTTGSVSVNAPAGNNLWCSLWCKFPAWPKWSYFDNYYPINGMVGRGSSNEFEPGFIVRNNGMAEFFGVANAQTAGASCTTEQLPIYYGSIFAGSDNTGVSKRVDFGRTGIKVETTTTSYMIVSTEFGLIANEDNWVPPVFENSWVNYGFDTNQRYEPAGFYKDSDGWVHLRGLVSQGTAANAAMFTLPVGCRPFKTTMGLGFSAANTTCRIDISNTGTVWAAAGGSTGWTSISGISFYGDQ